MADLMSEDLVTLRQAAALLPHRRGRPTAYSTVWRWATRGARGVVLETVVLGGGRVTSRQAISRFAAALTRSVAAGRTLRQTRAASLPTRRRAIEQAERVVDRALGRRPRAQ
jgi:hypothetical protein